MQENTAELIKMLENKRGTKIDLSLKEKTFWDSNAITPGTPFMDILAMSLKYWCAYKLNTDPAWAKVTLMIFAFLQRGAALNVIVESDHFGFYGAR